MVFDFKVLINRAKSHGKKFLVAESKDGGFELFFSEGNARLPDFIAGIVIEVAKKISSASGGKYSPTQALDGILKHVSSVARITLENHEAQQSGEEGDPVTLKRELN